MNCEKKTVLVKPLGGQQGHEWEDGVYSTVRQVEISHGDDIESIKIEYEEKGRSIWSEIHGGRGGTKIDKIRLDYPDEYLTSVHGYIGHLHERGPVFVRALSLESNKRQYGPFGTKQGTSFSFPKIQGRIVGFVGKSSSFLDAIGAYIEPFQNHQPTDICESSNSKTRNHVRSERRIENVSGEEERKNVFFSNNSPTGNAKSSASGKAANVSPTANDKSSASEATNQAALASKKVVHPAPYGPRLWGGEGGKPWDDGVYTGIKQIILTVTDAICCIKIEYDRDRKPKWSDKHGGTNGQTTNRVELDYPNEVLVRISGYFGSIKNEQGSKVVRSLTFHTSKKNYGPFGKETGSYFTSKVVGFHGKSSTYLDAIGVHMQHLSGNSYEKYFF